MESLPDIDQASIRVTLSPGYSYVPNSHALALDADTSIVSGIRGAGKSFWWTYLASPTHRAYLVKAFPEVRRIDENTILQGFGVGHSPNYPSSETIHQLTKNQVEARHVWRSVIGVCLGIPLPPFDGKTEWLERAVWVRDNPEKYLEAIDQEDERLSKEHKKALILFDALDRLAETWPTIRPIARALFQTALEMRAHKNIRLKLFVRPDMLEDEEITSFPDASKLLSRTVDLSWRRADLYALLFQRLGNAPKYGQGIRDHSKKEFKLSWRRIGQDASWVLPQPLRTDEQVQKELFHAITGPTMARGESGHKRGLPYTWLVNHLMDSREQVSPRSFFAALREASRASHDETWEYSLDPKSIQEGVAQASEIRKNEMVKEDYPWVAILMEPLGDRRLMIPCEVSDITTIWEQEGTIEKLLKRAESTNEVKLPPRHLLEGPKGILNDLKELGIIQRLIDGRVQMPDVYRIAFGLGRKGGVKPLR
jgi:hypothetical protein